MRSMLAGVALLFVSPGFAADRGVAVPFLRDGAGEPPYVNDATVKAMIPWLQNAGDRLDACYTTMTVPETLVVTYPPDVIAAHTAKQKLLSCAHEHGSEKAVCETRRTDAIVYFDQDPDQYFSLLDGLSLEEALPLFHALLAGEVRLPKGMRDPRLQDRKGHVVSISRKDGRLELGFGSCFSGGSYTVEQRQDSSGRTYYEIVSGGVKFMI